MLNRVLAFDFGGTKIAVAVGAADGRILSRSLLEARAEAGAGQAVERAVAEGRRLLGDGWSPDAVGVSSMGITREDRVELAPNVPGWDRLALPSRLRDAFGAPVAILNDVKAAGLAELRWGALQGVHQGIYVNLGTGIAVALVCGGEVVTGANEAAGEIGYCLRRPDEGPGAAAGHAPLEEWVAGAGLHRRAELELGRELSAAELAARARADARALRLLEDAAEQIVFQLTNLVIAFDPERVVIGGGLVRALGGLLERLDGSLRSYVPFPPQVRLAVHVDDAGLLGAIALAIDQLTAEPG